jgi:prepilin-type N-terminal cleavage/methylation domain-containing protein
MMLRMPSRPTRTRRGAFRRSRSTDPRRVRERSDDRGFSLAEMLIGVALLSGVVVAVINAVGVTVKATAYERDHAKAQQWLQAAVGVIEAVDFQSCDPTVINGAIVQQAYQEAVTVGRVDTNGDGVINGDDGARRPWEYDGELTVGLPEVWDGEQYVPFDTQTVCYDQSRLRQQLVPLVVTHPSGVRESVEMIKVDR